MTTTKTKTIAASAATAAAAAADTVQSEVFAAGLQIPNLSTKARAEKVVKAEKDHQYHPSPRRTVRAEKGTTAVSVAAKDQARNHRHRRMVEGRDRHHLVTVKGKETARGKGKERVHAVMMAMMNVLSFANVVRIQ